MKGLQVFHDLVSDISQFLVLVFSIHHPFRTESIHSCDSLIWIFIQHFRNKFLGALTSSFPDMISITAVSTFEDNRICNYFSHYFFLIMAYEWRDTT